MASQEEETVCDSVTKDFMVYLDTYDTYPQRLRLRMMEDRYLDGLLWQIERQLAPMRGASGESSQLVFPLESTNCEVFVCDPRDNALVPYGNATFDTLKATSKLLVVPRQSPEVTRAIANREEHLLADKQPTLALEEGPSGESQTALARDTVRHVLSKITTVLAAAPKANAEEWTTKVAAELRGIRVDDASLDRAVVQSFQAAFQA